jgi:hypothetical protein
LPPGPAVCAETAKAKERSALASLRSFKETPEFLIQLRIHKFRGSTSRNPSLTAGVG